MTSPGVWENVYLTIIPTFDGVCGMLYFIIIWLELFFPNIGMFAIVLYFLNMLGQLFLMLDVTDVVVTIGLPPLAVV